MADYFSPEKSKEREREISSLLGKDILEGESMRRLRRVSFLGILNIAAGVPESLRFNRYDHSVSVACLTWHFCQNLRLREEISLTATLSALIHDVTHPPFSHSAEVYLQIRSGVETKHTSALNENKITKVLKEGYDSLPRPLQKEGLKALATRLYKLLTSREERKKYQPFIADIFDTPFCPDTFDGINRAWYALSKKIEKYQSDTNKLDAVEIIDPISLISFISTTTHYPFVYQSLYPPSRANLIFKFHDLMRVLYNNVIYSDWQSSAMVMFARALEIAYLETKGFEISQDDSDVIKKIKKNPTSNKLYELIVQHNRFYTLSQENPSLYKFSLDYYTEAKKQNKSYKDIKKIIESMVAKELKVDSELVFWHKYRPLIWSSANIQFKEFGRDEHRWSLKWGSEGEPSQDPKIEIYYTSLL